MSQVNVDQWLEMLKRGECLDEKSLRLLCEKVKEVLIEESNLQPVSAPVTLVGDIHGQFADLIQIFELGGWPPEGNYVFMGDYVDRGHKSVEVMELLLCLKLRYPRCITLLRGNHETRMITMMYGFKNEVERKYGNPRAWHYFTEVFDYLCIGALVEGNVLCIHGGLSP